MFKKVITILLVLGLFASTVSCKNKKQNVEETPVPIKNVILLIGDGMGSNQIKAGEIYKKQKLYMQTI